MILHCEDARSLVLHQHFRVWFWRTPGCEERKAPPSFTSHPSYGSAGVHALSGHTNRVPPRFRATVAPPRSWSHLEDLVHLPHLDHEVIGAGDVRWGVTTPHHLHPLVPLSGHIQDLWRQRAALNVHPLPQCCVIRTRCCETSQDKILPTTDSTFTCVTQHLGLNHPGAQTPPKTALGIILGGWTR